MRHLLTAAGAGQFSSLNTYNPVLWQVERPGGSQPDPADGVHLHADVLRVHAFQTEHKQESDVGKVRADAPDCHQLLYLAQNSRQGSGASRS